jgi:GTPase SAR1 family protein
MSPLAERLNTARRRRFVGRSSECALVQAALEATELPFYVLYVFGPGGVGKTSLLQEFMQLSEQAGIPALYLDARNIEPTAESFGRAWHEVQISQSTGKQVLLLDTYELMAPLDDWLRDEFLPQLPDQTLVILAGRHPPSTAWRIDPGWQDLVRVLPLRNLNAEESRAYLTQRAIPQTQHQAVLDFTHGYPLALSLVVDVFAQKNQEIEFQPEAVSDVVKVLMERLIQEVPSPTHRMALEACALIRLTTETLLAGMLELPDVHELFEWLRGLSFIEYGTRGIFPHDLAREVLIADLRWRNPDRYGELHQRARTYYTTRLQQTQGQEQHAVLFDYIFLHRDNPAVRPRFTWQEHSSLTTDLMKPEDQAALVSMVTEHEGEASAQLASYWFQRQPEGILVFHNAQREPAGFVLKIALHQTTSEDRDLDSATSAAWDYLENHAPLRTGEGATLFRFWMAADTYQEVSPTQSLIFINFVQHHRLTPVAYTFFACANPDFWAAMFAYADLARLAEADFEVGGRHYGVYGHDWRVVPPKEWQALLAQREIAASAQAITPSTVSTPLLVLSQPDFVEAVHEVLRYFTRPDALHNHPLLQSRLVVERVGAQANKTERIVALQDLVREAAESLQTSPREAKGYRAVYHTYLHPAPTQEQAAEILDIPFSSFRRHLKTGMTRIAEILWHQEIR